MMCLFFLLACTKDEMNTFEGAIPFYKEGISNLRSVYFYLKRLYG